MSSSRCTNYCAPSSSVGGGGRSSSSVSVPSMRFLDYARCCGSHNNHVDDDDVEGELVMKNGGCCRPDSPFDERDELDPVASSPAPDKLTEADAWKQKSRFHNNMPKTYQPPSSLTPTKQKKVPSYGHEDDTTFDNLDNSGTTSSQVGVVTTVAAFKERRDTKVGLVFTRLKQKEATTIISRVLPDSIFRTSTSSSSLEGTIVRAVNGVVVRDPRHTAELVTGAEGDLTLTIVKQNSSSVNSSKKEMEIQLLKHEQRLLREQLAREKKEQGHTSKAGNLSKLNQLSKEAGDGKGGEDPDIVVYESDSDDEEEDSSNSSVSGEDGNVIANDARSTADWSEANVIENAFPSTKSGKGGLNTNMNKDNKKSNNEQKQSKPLASSEPTLMKQGAPVNFSAPVSDNDSMKSSPSKKKAEPISSEPSNLCEQISIESEESIQALPRSKSGEQAMVSESKDESNKDVQEAAATIDQEKSKRKKSMGISFKPRRVFGLKKNSPTRDAVASKDTLAKSPAASATAGQTGPQGSPKSVDINVTSDSGMSAEDIVNDLNSLNSSSRNSGEPKVVKSTEKDASGFNNADAIQPNEEDTSEGRAFPDPDNLCGAERASSFMVQSIVNNLSYGYESVTKNTEENMAFPSNADAIEEDEEVPEKDAEDDDEDGDEVNATVEYVQETKEEDEQEPTEHTPASEKSVDDKRDKKSPKKKKSLFKRVFNKMEASLVPELHASEGKQEESFYDIYEEVAKKMEEAVFQSQMTVKEPQKAEMEVEKAVMEKEEDDVAKEKEVEGVDDEKAVVEASDDKADEDGSPPHQTVKQIKEEATVQETAAEVAEEHNDEMVCQEDQREVQRTHEDSNLKEKDVVPTTSSDAAPKAKKTSFLKRAFKRSKRPSAKKEEIIEEAKAAEADVREGSEKREEADIVLEGDDESSANSAFSMIDLDVTSIGVEMHTPSKRGLLFDCALSPIANAASPSTGKQVSCSPFASGVDVLRTGSNNDATASCTDDSNEMMTYDNASPPSRLSSLPKTPPTPTKISEGLNISSFLFGTDPPSPSASLIGSTPLNNDKKKTPAAATPRCDESIGEPLMFECKLKHTSSGKESVNVSMERVGTLDRKAKDVGQNSSREQLQTPPPVNRKLNFDNFSESLCKASFQSWAVEDVTTVYRDVDNNSLLLCGGEGFPNKDMDEMELAQVKQHAFDIEKRSRSRSSNGGMISSGKQQTKFSHSVGSLRKNLFPKNAVKAGHEHAESGKYVHDASNVDVTLGTVDMTNELSMLSM